MFPSRISTVKSQMSFGWDFAPRMPTAGIWDEAEIVVDQIRTIDKSRLGDRVDAIGEAAAAEVRHVITLMYGVLSVRA